MSIPRAARLATELHCLNERGTIVITVQHWTDPDAPADRPRAWLLVLHNGVRSAEQRYFGPARAVRLQADLEQMRERFAPTALDGPAARAKIAELSGGSGQVGWMPGVRGRILPQPVSFTAIRK